MENNDNAETLELVVPADVEPVRIDRWLADQPSLASRGVTRSQIQGFIQDGLVYLGMRPAKASDRVRGGEAILVSIPEMQDLAAQPQDLKIDIVYQDEALAVVDKPAGMVTHPAKGSPDGTLVNALLHHIGDLSGIGGVIRPGIVHRLDKQTSGLLVVAKTDLAHQRLSTDLRRRVIRRTYIGLVHGTPRGAEGTVDQPIGRSPTDRKRMSTRAPEGRYAVTHWRLLRAWATYSLLEFRLETGRTHQIRVHMAAIGHPIVGDELYAGKKKCSAALAQALGARHFLHAAHLAFRHPGTGEALEFEAPLPPELERALATLKGGADAERTVGFDPNWEPAAPERS